MLRGNFSLQSQLDESIIIAQVFSLIEHERGFVGGIDMFLCTRTVVFKSRFKTTLVQMSVDVLSATTHCV